MIGALFIISLLVGFVVGLIPGIPGLIIFILFYRKRKQPALLSSYLVTTGVLIILLSVLNYYMRHLSTGAMTEESFSSFLSVFFFWGAIPGLSILLSNGVLFFFLKKP